MVARHSKQTPMPHTGPRGSFDTDCRSAGPCAFMITDATLLPEVVVTGLPSSVIAMGSAIGGGSPEAIRQVRLDGNRGFSAEHVSDNQLRRRQ